MRKLTATLPGLLILLVLLVLGSGQAVAADRYDSGKTYKGDYESARVYHRPPAERSDDRSWLDRRGFASTRQISCFDARNALNGRGEWTGNLDRAGNCLDPGEATEWATGNYLNYLERTGE